MERAERNGSALRRLLLTAERFSDAAIRLGSRRVKTPLSSVSTSLRSVTLCDQRRPALLACLRLGAALRFACDMLLSDFVIAERGCRILTAEAKEAFPYAQT